MPRLSIRASDHSRIHRGTRRASALFAPVLLVAACSGSSGSGFTNDPNDGGSGGTNGQFGRGDSGTLGGDDGTTSPGKEGCATGEAGATRQPVYLLFILDGSGSMNHDEKWPAAIGALDAIFDEMKTAADTGIAAGLIVYSDSQDPNLNTGGDYPSSRDVPVGFVDAAQHAKLVGRTASPDEPQSNTPTGRALTGGYAELGAFKANPPLQPNGKKVVVLLTDGIPTDHDCKTSNQDGTDDYTQNFCVKMAAAQLAGASQGPIETFVIGVGPLPGDFETYDPYFLGALAVAGGSAAPGCDPKANATSSAPCYFNVDPTGSTATATEQAFRAALDTIRGQVSECTLAITPHGGGTIDPNKVNVELGGKQINKDPKDGWTYDDPNSPTSITLHGAACDELKSDPNVSISIVLGCKSAIPK